MTEPSAEPRDGVREPALDRRFLLRGGAVLAGAAGAGVIGAALKPMTAEAAPVEYIRSGTANATSATTSITIGGSAGSASPPLALGNAAGPALNLAPTGSSALPELALGDIASTGTALYAGLNTSGAVHNDQLLTVRSFLTSIPLTYSSAPQRLVDTRTSAGRSAIVRTSPNAFDSKHRLRAKSWIDVSVGAGGGFEAVAVFVNLAASKPTGTGYLKVYATGEDEVPAASAVNFTKGHTTSNFSYVTCELLEATYAFRIWTSKTTHVVADLFGATIVYGDDFFGGQNAPGAARVPRLDSWRAVRKQMQR